jgi:hypothetical protein
MAKWQQGQSGNPNGRPPKNRAWTKILETAGNKTVQTSDGQRVQRKRIIADLIMQVAATGKATFPDGSTLEVSPKDWLDFVWKIYGQIDGPPKSEVDVTSGGEVLQAPVVYLPQPVDDDGSSDGPDGA